MQCQSTLGQSAHHVGTQLQLNVLRHRAKAMGIRLTDELIAFILSRFSRNLSSQLELLHQLDAYALEQQRPITIPLLRSMMENMA